MLILYFIPQFVKVPSTKRFPFRSLAHIKLFDYFFRVFHQFRFFSISTEPASGNFTEEVAPPLVDEKFGIKTGVGLNSHVPPFNDVDEGARRGSGTEPTGTVSDSLWVYSSTKHWAKTMSRSGILNTSTALSHIWMKTTMWHCDAFQKLQNQFWMKWQLKKCFTFHFLSMWTNFEINTGHRLAYTRGFSELVCVCKSVIQAHLNWYIWSLCTLIKIKGAHIFPKNFVIPWKNPSWKG